MKKGKIKNSKLVDLRFKAKNLLVANKVAQIERQEAARERNRQRLETAEERNRQRQEAAEAKRIEKEKKLEEKASKSLPNRCALAVDNYITSYGNLAEAYGVYRDLLETNGADESVIAQVEDIIPFEAALKLSVLKDFDNRTNYATNYAYEVIYYKEFDKDALEKISNIETKVIKYMESLQIKMPSLVSAINNGELREKKQFIEQQINAIRAAYPEKEVRTFEEASKELKDVMVEAGLVRPDKKALTRAKD